MAAVKKSKTLSYHSPQILLTHLSDEDTLPEISAAGNAPSLWTNSYDCHGKEGDENS